MSELALLSECVKNQTEASDGTVRFIYVDDETVYRFENNKMKKVSKSLIKKSLQEPKPVKKVVKKKIVQPVEPIAEEEDAAEDAEEDADDNIEPLPPPPPPKQKKVGKSVKQKILSQPSDQHLAEFYENKFRMEYMNKEIEHLTNKVNKLKQYKQIVNKLAGNEWGEPAEKPPTPQPASSRNDSLFMF